MKILILGGTRFLGYHLAKHLMEASHQVTLFNRGYTPDDFGEKVSRIHGDRTDYNAFYEKLKANNYDIVIDMIAFQAEDSLTAVKTFEGRVGHFFHVSSAAVYVVTKDYPCPLRENDFNRPLFPRPKKSSIWDYGYNKRKCEEILLNAHEKSGFPVTILRFPIIIGERDYTLRAYSYFLRILDGQPLILPDGGLNVFTHVYQGDIVRTLASNLKNIVSIGEAYNLAQEETVSLRVFVLKAAEIMARKAELVDIPSQALRKMGLKENFSPFSSRRPFILDIDKARKDLDYSPTPFDEWMRKTVFWFTEKYEGEPPENYKLRNKEIDVIERYKKIMSAF
jgi:nucleoside-diphosphate-sugar epimerase